MYEYVKDKININEAKLIALCGTILTGKTTIATKICEDISYNKNLPVVMFTLAETKEQIKHMCKNYNSNFSIIDSRNIPIDNIKKKLRKLKKERNIKLVVIDCLQLISCDKSKCLSRDIEINNICKELKQLTIDLDIPILVVYWLPRNHSNYSSLTIHDSKDLKEFDDCIFLTNNFESEGVKNEK